MLQQGSLPSVDDMRIPLLDHWAVGAQQQARRIAMIASTALAQQRAERLEVQDYLDSLASRTEVVRVAVAR